MNVIRLLRSGILGPAIFSALGLIAAQPAERNGINLARFDVSKLPREMVSEYLSPMEFRMLGFTKKGWIVLWDKDTRTETDSGCYVEMHVLNLTNDSDIDSVNSESCEISEEKRQRFIDRWQPKPSASSSLERFPLYAEGDKLIAEVRVRKEMEGEFDEYYGDVWLVSKERGLIAFLLRSRRTRASGSTICLSRLRMPNQTMKPTAPLRNKFGVFATTPCRGLSLSR